MIKSQMKLHVKICNCRCSNISKIVSVYDFESQKSETQPQWYKRITFHSKNKKNESKGLIFETKKRYLEPSFDRYSLYHIEYQFGDDDEICRWCIFAKSLLGAFHQHLFSSTFGIGIKHACNHQWFAILACLQAAIAYRFVRNKGITKIVIKRGI